MAHVLVVEDDLQVQETLVEAFMLFGHTVISAENGAQALQIFGEGYYDIAIVDVDHGIFPPLSPTGCAQPGC